MKKWLRFLDFLLLLGIFFVNGKAFASLEQLYHDLKLVEQVEKEITRRSPVVYSNSMLVGYLNTPSARVNNTGMIGLSATSVPPYGLLNLNIQPFSFVELSGNYRIFIGKSEENFGYKGFGDDADRTANFKISIEPFRYGLEGVPSFAVGMEDFYGSQRFYAPFVVVTQNFSRLGLEFSLGYGTHRVKGVFGGMSWYPWFYSDVPILKDIAFLAEYDGINYEYHEDEHPCGRDVNTRFNVGASWTLRNVFQLKVGSVRGKEVSFMGSFFYNFGETQGIFPKKDNPPVYSAPKNLEDIGPLRKEKTLAREMASAFHKQGFHLVEAKMVYSPKQKATLWLKIINIQYWNNYDVKKRIVALLSKLTPENIEDVVVVIEENGIDIESYRFLREHLSLFEEGKIGETEMDVLSPMSETPAYPSKYESAPLYFQRKSPWAFTMRPRVITFFGSTTGKLKWSFGWLVNPEGYLFDSIYYNIVAAYDIWSSLSGVGDKDQYNPSQLLNVRTDSVNYYKTQTVHLEQAYLQKGWNIAKGLFGRLATGYFEVAYAGIAGEVLYYPVNSYWAIGLEAATVLKRNYTGLGFQHEVRRLVGDTPVYEKYIGVQYFLDLYCDVKPVDISLQVQIGQFLAKDKGAKFVATKYFPSGLRFSLWYTVTNANDVVNSNIHHDKGIAFVIPFDVFLSKSSRSMVGYAMSAWLRDAGAVAATGKQLYPTIQSNRVYSNLF